jgi:hypothetical protein
VSSQAPRPPQSPAGCRGATRAAVTNRTRKQPSKLIGYQQAFRERMPQCAPSGTRTAGQAPLFCQLNADGAHGVLGKLRLLRHRGLKKIVKGGYGRFNANRP